MHGEIEVRLCRYAASLQCNKLHKHFSKLCL